METKSIKGTRTEQNLLKSFAGESQARARYTLFSRKAAEEGYQQIAALFLMTAEQELAHASEFFEHLEGGMVEITAAYPAGVVDDTLTNLKEAAAGEHEEWADLYPEFARVAEEEGFTKLAVLWRNICKVEYMHEQRYDTLYQRVLNGEEFSSPEPIKWMCRNCGYTVEANQAPKKCPICGKDQGWFERYPANY